MSETAGSVTKKRFKQGTTNTSGEQSHPNQPPAWYHSRSILVVALVVIVLALSWTSMLIHSETSMTLDQRVNQVASQLKCPICQGESVANSPSGLAQEMRSVIRQQLQEGRSEQQIIQYFEQRYGPSIIWSPPWQGFSLLAWLVPIVLLLGGTVVVFMVLLDWRRTAVGAPVGSSESALGTLAVDDVDLAEYRRQVEEELAAEDPLFWHREEQH